MMRPVFGLVVVIACLANTSFAQTNSGTSGIITGTWVGGLETDTAWDVYTVTIEPGPTLTGVGNLPGRGVSGAVQAVRLDDGRIQIKGPASLVVTAVLDGNVLTGDFEAQGGRQKGHVRLIRVAAVEAVALKAVRGRVPVSGRTAPSR